MAAWRAEFGRFSEYWSGKPTAQACVLSLAKTIDDLVAENKRLLVIAGAAAVAAERLACNHDFDPECGRCEWMYPLRLAVGQIGANDGD